MTAWPNGGCWQLTLRNFVYKVLHSEWAMQRGATSSQDERENGKFVQA